jgi:tight adherence protein C
MVAWLISALAGGAFLVAAAGIGDGGGQRTRLLALLATGPVHERVRSPRRTGTFLARLGRSKVGGRIRGSDLARRRLELAGHPFDFDMLRGLQVAAAAGGAAFILLFGLLWRPGLVLVPLIGVAGVRVPDLVLARRARRRQERIAAGVADLVELLLATTEAGLGPSVALRRTGEVVKGPLGEEVRAAVREVELGMPWQLAMEHLVDRTDVPSLRALAVALTRSQRLGSAVGVTLRRVMDELRRDRRLRAEEMARKAPLKMLFPLVFLILPAFLLLTVGPVVLATIRSLH